MIRRCVVSLLLWLLPLQMLAAASPQDDRKSRVRQDQADAIHLRAVTDRLRRKLDILERVEVEIVASNPLALSVETPSRGGVGRS